MNKYNPNIHHRRSIRLKGYDYSQAGLYYITICCQDRASLFGEIKNGEMILNDTGKIVEKCWLEISDHFPNTVLHEHVIMPNHVHGIIELVGANKHSPYIVNQYPTDMADQHPTDMADQYPTDMADQHPTDMADQRSTDIADQHPTDMANQHSTDMANQHSIDMANQHSTDNGGNGAKRAGDGAKDFSPLRSPSKTIGSVVRGFKIGVTKWMRQNTDVYDVWQRNYYEHIIRNEKSYQRISEYIINNPAKWLDDTFYKKWSKKS